MNIDEYRCDIRYVLQSRDFSNLHELASSCLEFEKYVASKVKNALACESEYTKKKAENDNKISESQQQIEALMSQIDEIKLQQKIVDKQITNVIKQQEKIQNEVENAKARRDALCLELVDLKQEVQERREKKRKQWNAIKRAMNVYKTNLDFGIKVEDHEYLKIVKVLFFINNESTKDKYYVKLIKEEESWRVEEIQPMLKKEHWIDLKGTVDFTKQSQISNTRAFLCLLRIVFLKYCMNTN